MKKYCVRLDCENSYANAEFNHLRDAKVFVNTLRKVNKHLDDKLKFHGWVTLWKGYQLDDESYVTESAELVKGLDF